MDTNEQQKALAEGLNVNTNELLTTSELCTNPSHYVREVKETGNRKILTKNGKPIAGIVPIWFLSIVDMNWLPNMDICSTCPGRLQDQSDYWENGAEVDMF